MSVLLIGDAEIAAIKAAIAHARANVLPWSAIKDHVNSEQKVMLMLEDRPPGFERPPSEHVMLGTYRAAISFEEQPAGLIRHLSASSHRPGMTPAPMTMSIICTAFGFSSEVCKSLADLNAFRRSKFQVWLEEFEPGHMAVNVAEVVE